MLNHQWNAKRRNMGFSPLPFCNVQSQPFHSAPNPLTMSLQLTLLALCAGKSTFVNLLGPLLARAITENSVRVEEALAMSKQPSDQDEGHKLCSMLRRSLCGCYQLCSILRLDSAGAHLVQNAIRIQIEHARQPPGKGVPFWLHSSEVCM